MPDLLQRCNQQTGIRFYIVRSRDGPSHRFHGLPHSGDGAPAPLIFDSDHLASRFKRWAGLPTTQVASIAGCAAVCLTWWCLPGRVGIAMREGAVGAFRSTSARIAIPPNKSPKTSMNSVTVPPKDFDDPMHCMVRARLRRAAKYHGMQWNGRKARDLFRGPRPCLTWPR